MVKKMATMHAKEIKAINSLGHVVDIRMLATSLRKVTQKRSVVKMRVIAKSLPKVTPTVK